MGYGQQDGSSEIVASGVVAGCGVSLALAEFVNGNVPCRRMMRMIVMASRKVLRRRFFHGPGIHLVRMCVEDWAAHNRGTVPRLKQRARVAPVRADPDRSETPKMR
jgi:hypothetical protein